jgi:hypothetical protein
VPRAPGACGSRCATKCQLTGKQSPNHLHETRVVSAGAAIHIFDGQHYDCILDLLRHAILQHWLLAADFLQSQFAALVVKLIEAVEAVAAAAHHLAGLADIAELLRKLQQGQP